jgi:hypothetical protein
MPSGTLIPQNLSNEDAAILLAAALAASNGGQDLPASMVIVGDEIEYHDRPKITLPRDMSLKKARDILTRVERDQETEVAQEKEFKYRPYDGAVACARVMKEMFGITFGERIRNFFRDDPPQTLSVPISLTETLEVPWGMVSIPTLPGTRLHLGSTRSREHGDVFKISAVYPKKHTNTIKDFFRAVEKELKNNSIYRGKAILGTGAQPEFYDNTAFKSAEIVFSDDVEDVLNGTVWSVLKYRQQLKKEGVRVKRAALLHGPYGCGKTSALQMTCEIAIACGWTYIKVRTSENVHQALQTARLYAPAVVAIEDIDNEASTAEGGEVAKLLESFDGMTSKGHELVMVMTTNHLDKVHKGMLRPGRLDAVIEIAELDRGGIERLIRAVVAQDKLDAATDWDVVYDAMSIERPDPEHPGQTKRHGFYPAFVREALERAKTVAISNAGGKPNYLLGTEALRVAALSLHDQLRTMLDAEEGQPKPVFDSLLRATIGDEVGKVLHGAVIVDHGDLNSVRPSTYYDVRIEDLVSDAT